MSRRTFNQVTVTGKLTELLKEKGYTMTDASRLVGRSSNYLSNAIRLGRLDSMIAELLELKLQIKPEEYEKKPEEKPAETEPTEAEPKSTAWLILEALRKVLHSQRELEEKIDRIAKEVEGI